MEVEVQGEGRAIPLTVVYNYHGVHVNTVSRHASTRFIFFSTLVRISPTAIGQGSCSPPAADFQAEEVDLTSASQSVGGA